MTADHVTITVPLAVLQAGDTAFDPPLSLAPQAAISVLGMGLLKTCWPRFDRCPRPDDLDWIKWLGSRPDGRAHWGYPGHVMSAPVLLAFHAANAARDLERQSDAALDAREWQGALVFAGGVCSPEWWGTAHGAVLSGRPVAKTFRG